MKIQQLTIEANFRLQAEPTSHSSWKVYLDKEDFCLFLNLKTILASAWAINYCDYGGDTEPIAKGSLGAESVSIKLKAHTIHIDKWSIFVEKTDDQPKEDEEWLAD